MVYVLVYALFTNSKCTLNLRRSQVRLAVWVIDRWWLGNRFVLRVPYFSNFSL